MTVITFDISIVNALDYMVLIVNLKIFLYFIMSFLMVNWFYLFLFHLLLF